MIREEGAVAQPLVFFSSFLLDGPKEPCHRVANEKVGESLNSGSTTA